MGPADRRGESGGRPRSWAPTTYSKTSTDRSARTPTPPAERTRPRDRRIKLSLRRRDISISASSLPPPVGGSLGRRKNLPPPAVIPDSALIIRAAVAVNTRNNGRNSRSNHRSNRRRIMPAITRTTTTPARRWTPCRVPPWDPCAPTFGSTARTRRPSGAPRSPGGSSTCRGGGARRLRRELGPPARAPVPSTPDSSPRPPSGGPSRSNCASRPGRSFGATRPITFGPSSGRRWESPAS
mmetsp:Transcript_10956/g.32427  ORF Transcript_10956/g.32427 Transcript_10956/m.32427 type:complete len:239 (-) Transcript_10956:1181-1897(-)